MKKRTLINLNSFIIITLLLSVTVSCRKKESAVTPETALQAWLNNDDDSYNYTPKDTVTLDNAVAYDLLLTSQQWRQYLWKHRLTVIVPEETRYDEALLFITGGKNKDGEPVVRGNDHEFITTLTELAKKNKAIISILWQVPNQPLFDSLNEDEIISYTLHQFKNDSDYTWPLLFPMVKSAVKAMDAVQDFSEKSLHHPVHGFVVTGASKRGWTTWLTGASDPRVRAIAPMVIDVLNMPVNLDYQLKAWGKYSIQIEDYVKLGIPQEVHTGKGNAITTMIDPYAYRDKLIMPKMIIIGTNDEYWPVDAVRNYIDSIPGENFIVYVPNAGHGLGDGTVALNTLSAFFGRTVSGKPYPACGWSSEQKDNEIILHVTNSPEVLAGATLWSAKSDDRDFRDEEWSSENIPADHKDHITVTVPLPEAGYLAFYVDLTYPDPNGGDYVKSTRMFIADTSGILND